MLKTFKDVKTKKDIKPPERPCISRIGLRIDCE